MDPPEVASTSARASDRESHGQSGDSDDSEAPGTFTFFHSFFITFFSLLTKQITNKKSSPNFTSYFSSYVTPCKIVLCQKNRYFFLDDAVKERAKRSKKPKQMERFEGIMLRYDDPKEYKDETDRRTLVS